MAGAFDHEEQTRFGPRPDGRLPRHRLRLLGRAGPVAGAVLPLPRWGGVIGRKKTSDVAIADPAVSERHAAIIVDEDGEYVLRDLGSRYGTFVDGAPGARVVLADGMVVQLSAESVLRVWLSPVSVGRRAESPRRDELTGLGTRAYFMERLDEELAHARRHRLSLPLLVVDLDHFQRLGDPYGPAGPAEALRQVGRHLARATRREDLIAYAGRDRFLVASRDPDADAPARLANRLLAMFRSETIDIEGACYHLTASIGVAVYTDPSDPASSLELVARADAALLAAKRGGRDRWSLWAS